MLYYIYIYIYTYKPLITSLQQHTLPWPRCRLAEAGAVDAGHGAGHVELRAASQGARPGATDLGRLGTRSSVAALMMDPGDLVMTF